MAEQQSVVVEGESLQSCRIMAAKELALPPDQISLNILQQGSKGLFRDTPYRVRATKREDDKTRRSAEASSLLAKLGQRARIVEEEMKKLDLLGNDREQETFEKLLDNYDALEPAIREEVKDIANLLEDESDKKLRDRIARDGRY
ncbi:MAG: Jag N-terminal domain-containing protein, partial [Planctomycetota bacterium]